MCESAREWNQQRRVGQRGAVWGRGRGGGAAGAVVEDCGEEVVEEGPELMEVVLEGGPGDEEPVGGPEVPDGRRQQAGLGSGGEGGRDHRRGGGQV